MFSFELKRRNTGVNKEKNITTIVDSKLRYSHLYPCDILRRRGRAKSVGGRESERERAGVGEHQWAEKIKLSGKSRTWDHRVIG